MTRNFSRVFAFLFIVGFIFSVFSPLIFAEQLELQYPDVAGAESPNTTRELPKVIKYLFNLGLAVSGFIAFGSFVYGGIRYLFSAGNPGALQDARDRIFASLLVIVGLFGSYMLLTTINPELVVLQLPATGSARGGIILYSQPGCPSGGEDDKDYIRAKSDVSYFGDEFVKNPVRSIRFFSSSDEVNIALYPAKDYKPIGQPIWKSEDVPGGIHPPSSGQCVDTGDMQAQSADFTWKSPGIYLFAGSNCKGDARLFAGNTSSFGDFEDKAKSLMIIPTLEKIPMEGPLLPGEDRQYINVVKEKLGAILYENGNFKEDAAVFLGGEIPDPSKISDPNYDYNEKLKPVCVNLVVSGNPLFTNNTCANNSGIYCKEPIGANRASSLRVFRQVIPRTIDGNVKDPGGLGVIVYGNYQFNEQSATNQQVHCGPINAFNSDDTHGVNVIGQGKPLWVDENWKDPATGQAKFNASPDDVRGSDSKEDCKEVFGSQGTLQSPSRVSSISVDGNYMGILFRDDGRGEAFLSPGDIRLSENHIGDDKAKFLLVIPLQPK